jgi:hypothetical protein
VGNSVASVVVKGPLVVLSDDSSSLLLVSSELYLALTKARFVLGVVGSGIFTVDSFVTVFAVEVSCWLPGVDEPSGISEVDASSVPVGGGT